MKRILLAVCCALALLLVGCTEVNQTNSFVEMPTPEITAPPLVTATPEATATPAGSSLPSLPPMVQLEVIPTDTPGESEQPLPAETPDGNPDGING